MAGSQIASGARARFSINGVKVAFATGVNVYEGIQYEGLNVLDNIETAEFVPVGYEVRGDCDLIRVVGGSAKAKGWFPASGKTPEEHLANILAQGEVTAIIEDPPTGKIICQLVGVKIAEHNLRVQARAITGENVSFVARVARDEADLA